MVGSRVPIRRVRAGGKPMPLTSGQRSLALADREVAAVLAANPGSRRISGGNWNDRIDQVSVC